MSFWQNIKRKICDIGLWIKKKIIWLIGLFVFSASAATLQQATINEISVEKVQQKYEQATQIKEKYQLDGVKLKMTNIKNSELDAYKHEPKDEIEVILGDDISPTKSLFGAEGTTSDEFMPSITLRRWNETQFKLSPVNLLKNVATKDKNLTFNNDKVVFSTPKISFEFYESTDTTEGGYKMVWFLNEKPINNKIEFNIESSGLNFYYQPPLTDEYQNGFSQEFATSIIVNATSVQDLDGNVLMERPENVVGSYAVYHSTKGGMNDVYGKDYKVGKAFHIFRPHIIDAEGKETWGILKIENGIYSVEIPQDFLDKAIYPIKSNDELGYHTIGKTLQEDSSDYMFAGKFPSSANGTISSLTIYTHTSTYDDGPAQVGIYKKDGDGGDSHSLEGSNTSAFVPTTNDWTTRTLTASILTGSEYLLSIWAEEYSWNYDTTSVEYQIMRYSLAYPGAWPDPLNVDDATFWNNNSFSIYATYTPVSGGGTTPIPQVIIIE